jgi:hypothetical protein
MLAPWPSSIASGGRDRFRLGIKLQRTLSAPFTVCLIELRKSRAGIDPHSARACEVLVCFNGALEPTGRFTQVLVDYAAESMIFVATQVKLMSRALTDRFLHLILAL